MKNNLKPVAVTVAISLVGGFALGSVVAFAMHRVLSHYMRFVGFTAVVAPVLIGTWVYRTYMHPKQTPTVEEAETSS